MGLGCETSKRRRSGATSEPFWATWVPRIWRSASWMRCVAEWLARMARRRRAVDAQLHGIAGLEGAGLDDAGMDEQIAELLLRIGDAEQRRPWVP